MQWYDFEEFENSGVVLVLDLCNAEQNRESVILCSVCVCRIVHDSVKVCHRVEW